MLERRSFLRGLASLPLIGGGVTLIGNPTAAAVPVTDALHARYTAWLAHEHRAAMKEHARRSALAFWTPCSDAFDRSAEAYADRVAREANYMLWFPDVPDVAEAVSFAPASSRAAVILSAAGVSLVGGAGV